MGCLFALFAGVFPRFALIIFWILRPARVDAAFDTWLLPLLGIIFLPLATLMYAVLHIPGDSLGGWEWFWIVLAGVLDVTHWAASATQRDEVARLRSGRGGADLAP
jgi:hypothetical protein